MDETTEQLVRDHEAILRGAYGQPGLLERMRLREEAEAGRDKDDAVRDIALTALRWTLTLLIPACTAIAIAVITR